MTFRLMPDSFCGKFIIIEITNTAFKAAAAPTAVFAFLGLVLLLLSFPNIVELSDGPETGRRWAYKN